MINPSKTSALKSANVFFAVSGGVQHPHNLANPDGPYTVTNCADDCALKLARLMRVSYALELMGFDERESELEAERAAEWCGSARDILNSALLGILNNSPNSRRNGAKNIRKKNHATT